MHKVLLAMALAVTAAMAQNAAPADPATGSIGGVVKDAGTGAPMAGVQVSVNPTQTEAATDSNGRYVLRGLAPGTYRVAAHGQHGGSPGFGPSAVKHVALAAGQDLGSVDFQLQALGEISGKVLDENKEPIPGIKVFLVAREYRLGALRYVFTGAAHTDDRGEYHLQRAQPGRPYLIMADGAARDLKPVSDVPADPKLRMRVRAPTFYPDAISLDGGQAVTLRAGEHREGVDLQMVRSPSYCVDGVLEAEGRPAALLFEIRQEKPSSGRSGGGGFFTMAPHGNTGPDGKIRICDLHPDDYQITAAQFQHSDESVPFFGTTTLTIADRDVHNVKVAARARLTVPGEVVWYGTAPEQPVPSKISVSLDPMTRARWGNESNGLYAQPSIPGNFSFPGLLLDDYEVSVHGIPHNLYLKGIIYGGVSILHEPLRVGSAMGQAELRVVVAPDGGYISAKVADKESNPVPDSYVLIMPESATTEPLLAAQLISGQTDQNGMYSSDMLAPGKYLLLASLMPVDMTPESIGKLWRARSHAQEVEIGPSATMQVTLAPAAIE